MSHDIESYCKTCGICTTSKDTNSKPTGLLHSLPIPDRPCPCPIKAVELTTAPSPGTFEQYTLLDQLSDAAKAKTQPCNDTMIADEPVKPVAGSSKHPDDTDVIDGELIY